MAEETLAGAMRRRVLENEARIERQKIVIGRLRAHGRDTRVAERLLGTLKETHEQDRCRLHQLLAERFRRPEVSRATAPRVPRDAIHVLSMPERETRQQRQRACNSDPREIAESSPHSPTPVPVETRLYA